MPAKKAIKPISKLKTATTATTGKAAPQAPAKAAKKDSLALTKTAETVGGILGAVVGTAENLITTASDALVPKPPAKKTPAKKKTHSKAAPATTKTPVKGAAKTPNKNLGKK